MDKQYRVSDAQSNPDYGRSDRFLEKADGVYLKTREGMDGPFSDMAIALNALLKIAEKENLSQFQTRQLYESICLKALDVCDSKN